MSKTRTKLSLEETDEVLTKLKRIPRDNWHCIETEFRHSGIIELKSYRTQTDRFLAIVQEKTVTTGDIYGYCSHFARDVETRESYRLAVFHPAGVVFGDPAGAAYFFKYLSERIEKAKQETKRQREDRKRSETESLTKKLLKEL